VNFARRFVLKLQRKWRTRAYASRIAGCEQIAGYLSLVEACHLCHFAARLPLQAVIVEIGSWKGRSTFCLAQGLNSGVINAIDPFDASGSGQDAETYAKERGSLPLAEQFQRNLQTAIAARKVVMRQGLSARFVGQFPVIHFLFIDGDHSMPGCRFDYEHFAPNLVVGGYLAFHDYRPWKREAGPTHVVENLVKPSGEFATIGLFDTLWVARRVKPPGNAAIMR
jgi:predicted O-methyltransferase YrrM